MANLTLGDLVFGVDFTSGSMLSSRYSDGWEVLRTADQLAEYVADLGSTSEVVINSVVTLPAPGTPFGTVGGDRVARFTYSVPALAEKHAAHSRLVTSCMDFERSKGRSAE